MYTMVDPKSFWPQQCQVMPTLPAANQFYVTQVPVTPTYLIGGAPPQMFPMAGPNQAFTPTVPATTSPTTPAMYYSLQPNWTYQHPCVPAVTSSRQRTSSDDVFVVDTPHHPHTYPTPLPLPPTSVSALPRRRQRMVGAADDDDVMSLASLSPLKDKKRRERSRPSSCMASSDSSGSEFSPPRSLASGRSSGTSSTRSSMSPQNAKTKGRNHHDSMEQSSTAGSHREAASTDINDFSLFNIFSASLYSALNRDPPEPTSSSLVHPLKTSSPIPSEKAGSNIHLVPQTDVVITSHMNTVERDSELEHFENLNLCEGQTRNRRQKFLRALEDERERQRRFVLPKQAPKMTCKFCKNNGESFEVYSKHRLHFNEKTVCPLLRMYVCRLCNSTGDFAHTIRHCPFNSRFDKVAWKATFL